MNFVVKSMVHSQISSLLPEPPPITSPWSWFFAFLFSAHAAAKKVLNVATKGQFLINIKDRKESLKYETIRIVEFFFLSIEMLTCTKDGLGIL